VLKLLDHHIFAIVTLFYRSHLNRTYNSLRLNLKHFHLYQLNGFKFHGLLKSLDHDIFHNTNHFRRFRLSRINDRLELNLKHFYLHYWNRSKFHKMWKGWGRHFFLVSFLFINFSWIEFTIDSNWI
jgi:hypothetical protein